MPRVVVAAAVLLALVVPAAASATDRFVSTSGNDMAGANDCTSAAPACVTLMRAVTAANLTGDTIHIGPGTFAGGINTAKKLTFQGAGSGTLASAAGATVIDGSPNQVITMSNGGVLQDIRAIGGATANTTALVFDIPAPGAPVDYTLTRVVAFGGNCDSCRALEVRDQSLGLPDPAALTAHVSSSTIVGTGGSGSSVFIQSANADFSGSSIVQQGNPGGALLMELGTLVFSDGTLGTPGLTSSSEVAVGGHATFTRTRFAGNDGLRLDGLMLPVDVTLVDSLAVGSSFGMEVLNGSTATIRNSTVAAEGPTAQAAVSVQGSGADSTVTSSGSILRATAPGAHFDVQLAQGGGHSATFVADHSAYSSVDTSGGGTATPAGSGTNVAADPGFVNEAGGDFHLPLSSPLIERGGAATPGETDLDGGARSVDGNCDGTAVPDIGAFELARSCPAATGAGAAPVLSKVRMTHRRFRVGTPAAARTPKGTRFIYTLSEAAKVTITIERRAVGAKKGRRCVKPKRGLHGRCIRFVRQGALSKPSAKGANSLPFSGKIGRRTLRPGRYRARLVAVDGSGARSKERRLNFTVVTR
ncbi:MAG TPA: hypothetical protein VH256_02045 [Thermoleophilaceae bacterium]|nr:hypothetical protein [Thermoleophilaceae bacterium]